jgi:hypothetical protein
MSSNTFNSENLSDYEEEEDEETRNQSEKEKRKNNKAKEIKESNVNIINSISEALTLILEENKKLKNYKELIVKQSKMIFSSKSIPSISLYDYLKRIQKYTQLEKSTLIITLILIDHICEKAHLTITYYNIHRILFGAILISIKYNEDTIYDNKYYAEVGGVKLNELKMIEYSFLVLSNFNVCIKNEEYEHYKNYLEGFYEMTQLENQ